MHDPKNNREIITEFNVVVEKEFYPLKSDSVAAVLMVKNEKKRIHISLNSILGFVDAIVIYDTGSIDNTMDIITEFAEKNTINLYMIKGEFVDFSYSRNVMLDYAATKPINLLLLLDCNDELKNGESFREFCKTHESSPYNCFLLCQQWYHGGIDKYYNVRLIRNNANIRYKGVVHEYINSPVDKAQVFKHNDKFTFYIYQDRTQDDDKTSKRFIKDREMLLKEYHRDPTDARTIFYLAQTYGCLGQAEEALYFNRMRKEMKESFPEEIFHAALREGDLRRTLGHSWGDIFMAYMDAAEVLPDRVEPYLNIARYYRSKDMWSLAYKFVKIACQCDYPTNCLLFIDKKAYDYERWHEMGRIGFYAKKFEDGRQGCLKAIEAMDLEIDKHNLKFYDLKLNTETPPPVLVSSTQLPAPSMHVHSAPSTHVHTASSPTESIPENGIENLSKKEFVKIMTLSLLKQDPDMPANVLNKKIQTLWDTKK